MSKIPSDPTTQPKNEGSSPVQRMTSSSAPIQRTISSDAPYSSFTKTQKWAIVFLVATAGVASPLAGNAFLPAVPAVASDLKTSTQAILLSITAYMIFQGISPTFWAGICDVLGRRITYIGTFTVFVAASLALSFTPNYAFLVVFRCLQAAGSASVIAIGSGTIGDISTPRERGLYMSLFQVGPMTGPVIGPIFSGFLSEAFGWRSVFYFLSAYGFVLLLAMILFMPETLRSIVGNGSIVPPAINRSLYSLIKGRRNHEELAPQPEHPPPKKTWRDIKWLAPIKVFREIDCLCLLTFNSMVYALYYCVITSISSILKRQYSLSEGLIGVSYLPVGVGSLIATFATGPIMNHNYRAIERELIEREGEHYHTMTKDEKWLAFPIEHARLRALRIPFVIMIAATIAYGWALQADAPLAVPLVLQAIIGFLIMFPLTATSTMLVDLFPEARASATAANNLYRCLLGAGGTAVIDPLLNNLGPGKAFTLIACIDVAFAPLAVLLWYRGHTFRHARAARLRKQANKDADTSEGRDEQRKDDTANEAKKEKEPNREDKVEKETEVQKTIDETRSAAT